MEVSPAAFRSSLTKGLALSSIKCLISASYLLEGPLKQLSQRDDFNALMDPTFRRKIPICIVELLKVFLHPSPPLERERFVRNAELRIPKSDPIVNGKNRIGKNRIVKIIFLSWLRTRYRYRLRIPQGHIFR